MLKLTKKRTVSSITSGLSKMASELRGHANEQEALMEDIDGRIDLLKEQRLGAMAERQAATKVADNIDTLLEV